MPRTSISTLLAVAGVAAGVALLMNRHVMQPQHSGGDRRGGGGSSGGQAGAGRAAGQAAGQGGSRQAGQADAAGHGLAAIAPAAAAEAPHAGADFVRPAGPEAMRDTPRRGWDKTDEASDESFPASDPPATY